MADTWHLTVSGGGGHAHYPFHGVEGVWFQVWDLMAGRLAGEFAGELLNVDKGLFWRWEDWGSDVTAFSCADAPHLVFTTTGAHRGEDLEPVELVQPASLTTLEQVGDYPESWQLLVQSDASDEVWIWIAYPRTSELWGPYLALRGGDGQWSWAPDETMLAVLHEHEAVFSAIGCASGVPVGTATVEW